jgi:hypothetical protein
MSQFLLACIEEAKKAGIYTDDPSRVMCSDIPASITILDTDTYPCTQNLHASDGLREMNMQMVNPICTTEKADVPPFPPAPLDSVPSERMGPQARELAEEVMSLHKQLKLSAETISQQVSEIARMKRNHGYDLRLLQKTVLSSPSKDMKGLNDLNQRFIKLATERDMLASKGIQTEEQLLALKHYVITLVNERNQLIHKLENHMPVDPRVSLAGIGNVLVLSMNRVSKLSFQSFIVECHRNPSEQQILVDLRQL